MAPGTGVAILDPGKLSAHGAEKHSTWPTQYQNWERSDQPGNLLQKLGLDPPGSSVHLCFWLVAVAPSSNLSGIVGCLITQF